MRGHGLLSLYSSYTKFKQVLLAFVILSLSCVFRYWVDKGVKLKRTLLVEFTLKLFYSVYMSIIAQLTPMVKIAHTVFTTLIIFL